MQVGVVTPFYVNSYPHGASLQPAPQPDDDHLNLPENNELPVTPPAPSPADLPQDDSPQTKGVIRLLQQGHFQGVADVRLRINFFDELSAIENAQLKAALGPKANELFDAVAAGLNSLTESLTDEQLNPLIENFSQALTQAQEEFLSSGSPSNEALADTLKSAFATLINSLNEILNPAAPPNPPLAVEIPQAESPADQEIIPSASEETPPAPPAADNQSPAAPDLMENLTTIFHTALNELISRLDEVQILPDLSAPAGNGRAYDKFLALYNELKDIQPQPLDPQLYEPLDLTA